MITVLINQNSYQMEKPLFLKTVLPQVKASMGRTNSIYCLEKTGIFQMVKEQYPDKESLMSAAKRYISKGFKVHYMMVG